MQNAPKIDHPEWLGLLAEICEDPFDRGLRLIAADWLEDNGHVKWAREIRDPHYVPGKVRCADGTSFVATMVGGFVKSVFLSLPECFSHGVEVVREHPVREIGITDRATHDRLRLSGTCGFSYTSDALWDMKEYRDQTMCLPRSLWEKVDDHYQALGHHRKNGWDDGMARSVLGHVTLMRVRELAGLTKRWEYAGEVVA